MSSPTRRPGAKPNWFIRHKVLTVLLALLLVGFVLDNLRNQTKTKEVSSRKAPRSAKAATWNDMKPNQRQTSDVLPQPSETGETTRESPSVAWTDLPPIPTATSTAAPGGSKSGWFIRHKVLTSLLVLLVVGLVLDNAGDRTTTNEVSSRKAVARSAKAGLVNDTKPTRRRSHDVFPQLSKTRETRRESRPAAPGPRNRHTRRYLVTDVVDGDTIELANGAHVRLVGIAAPERGECGYHAATANMERLVLGKRVRLRIPDENRHHHGRLLRYVNIRKMDAGLRQIKAGLAIALNGSRDGFGHRARENRYTAADIATPNKTCH